MGHGHGHGERRRPRSADAASRALAVSAALHAAFMVVEAVVGWWTGSLALLSDAGHMLSDVGALLLAYFAQRLREVSPNDSYTFGLRRLPVLGGLVNGISLLAIVVLIVVEAIDRLGAPEHEILAAPVLVAGVIGLGVNLVGAWLLHRSGDESINVRGALLHVIADALGSVAAIVAAIVILLTGWSPIDAIASVVIAALILGASLPLLRDAMGILLQRAPAGLDVAAARAAIAAVEGVSTLRDLHVWQLDTGQTVASAVILSEVGTLEEAAALADRIRQRLHDEFHVDHATLEIRPSSAPAPHHHF
ncbi:MAG: cation transporter [Myxococcales bacterium]|nr:cation transporter [Myxococcales bacterium]